jgi:hypothetical protein
MKRILLSGSLAGFLVALPQPAGAWIERLDGSSVPGASWYSYNDAGAAGGDTVVVDFVDPDTGANNQALRINSGPGSNEYYLGDYPAEADGAEVVIGARFRVVDMSSTGSENLLCATTYSAPGELAPAPSITLVDGQYKLWTYIDQDDQTGSEIMDLGPAVLGQFHTAYLYARKDGTVKLLWDGAWVFNGIAPVVSPLQAWVEWGSGSWQADATDTVDFDWIEAAGGLVNSADVAAILWPTLSIERQGDTAFIAWSADATGFVLQATTNLSHASWTDIPGTSGNTYTDDLSGPARFYRLRK